MDPQDDSSSTEPPPQQWTSRSSVFPYQSLNADRHEIRLLQLDRTTGLGAADGLLRLTIKHETLQDGASSIYEAISYCWGKNPVPQDIILDGIQVAVPASAVAAIRGTHQSPGSEGVPFWIDAICINQSDIAEKSQQVAMMDRVYSKAAEVLVWLGEDANETAGIATQLIHDFGEWFVIFKRDYGAISGLWHPTSGVVAECVENFFEPRSDELKFLVSMLWDCPWFERVWAMQEVFLARHATCFRGTYSIEWDDIAELGEFALRDQWLDAKIERIKTGLVTKRCQGSCLTITGMLGMWRKSGQPDLANVLVISTGSVMATDPRDRVYGILGLLRDPKPLIRPDYSLRVREVYIVATVSAMNASEKDGLRLLAHAQAGSCLLRYRSGARGLVDTASCPSWVPRYDLTAKWDEGTPAFVGVQAASAKTEPVFSVNLQTAVLRVKGCTVGSIDTVCSAFRSVTLADTGPFFEKFDIEAGLDSLTKYASRLVETFKLVRERSDGWTTRNLQMLARSLVLGNYEGTRTAGWQALVDFSALALELRQCDIDTSSLPTDEMLIANGAQDGRAMDFFHHVFVKCVNRFPFMTDSGYFGIAPLFAEKGDVVCILYGCPVPLILRKNDSHWHLMGDAYVHDVMDGQHIEQLQADGSLESQSEWFEIN